MKNYLGECNLTVTRPNGEWSEILVSNPGNSSFLGGGGGVGWG